MTTRQLCIRLTSIGMALAVGVAFSRDAAAQQVYRTWIATPAPMTQYYTYHYAQPTCPGGACPANQPQYPACPNGNCPTRTWVPTAAPVDSIRNGVQRVFSPALPLPQTPSRPETNRTPSANRESPYYEYKAGPVSPSPRRPPLQSVPTNNDSPYYP